MKPRFPSCLLAVLLAAAGQAGAAAEGTAKDRPNIVYLQRSAQFGIPRPPFLVQGALLRETQRQAFLIAAREQLGLVTRDYWLGDAMPGEGGNEPFEVVTVEGPPTALEVRRGFYPAAKTMGRHVPKIVSPPGCPISKCEIREAVDPRAWLVEAETLSRTVYVEAIRKAGFDGKPVAEHAGAGVPEDIEKNLAEMVFTSQYAAVRGLHELIRTDGQSPARLEALVRGYANLGWLTEFHWHPAHKVFKARALLYAQRMVAAEPKSARALWHRAYAFAAAGLHWPAIQDLEASERAWKEAKEKDRPARPAWVDLVDAHCRFDLGRLEPGKAEQSCRQLAGVLRCLTVELSGGPTATVAGASKAARTMPECYRIHEMVCGHGGVASGHQASMAWLMIAGTALYPRVAAMPGLPEPVGKIAREATSAGGEQDTPYGRLRTDIAREFELRPRLVRALIDSSSAKEPKTPDAAERQPPAASSNNSGDCGEPSWACLGHLIAELSFVQVRRRLYFEWYWLGVPNDEFRKVSAPLVADHPYALLLETYTSDERAQAQAWKKFCILVPEALNSRELGMVGEYVRHNPAEWSLLEKVCNDYRDETVQDLSPFLSGPTGEQADTIAGHVLAVSPYSIAAKVLVVEQGSKKFQSHLDSWEKTAAQHPQLCRAFGMRYALLKRYDEAAHWLETAITAEPDVATCQRLAEIRWAQGKEAEWLAAMEKAAGQKDFGLGYARALVEIARYFMWQRDWDKALSYADKAAETYSQWGLLVACECREGMHRWEEAETMHRAIAQRYPECSGLDWYFFCRRTGHGDLKAARRAAKEYVEASQAANSPRYWNENVAAYYLFERQPEKAKDILARSYREEDNFITGIHLALLCDQLKDAATRDKILAEIKARGPKSKLPDNLKPLANMTGLAGLLADDLAKGGKGEIDLAAADRLNTIVAISGSEHPRYDPGLRIDFDYLLGRYLYSHGKREQAIEYWKHCVARTQFMTDYYRTLAAAQLTNLGILPESYKSLLEKDGGGKTKAAEPAKP
jgi:tetratricopeptide (TPR) repeat protein